MSTSDTPISLGFRHSLGWHGACIQWGMVERDIGWHGPEGKHLRSISFNRANLKRRVISMGGTVEDDSSGRWTVLQLVAPVGKLWADGVHTIRVEWPTGESSLPAIRDAFSRIAGELSPIPESDKELYAED